MRFDGDLNESNTKRHPVKATALPLRRGRSFLRRISRSNFIDLGLKDWVVAVAHDEHRLRQSGPSLSRLTRRAVQGVRWLSQRDQGVPGAARISVTDFLTPSLAAYSVLDLADDLDNEAGAMLYEQVNAPPDTVRIASRPSPLRQATDNTSYRSDAQFGSIEDSW